MWLTKHGHARLNRREETFPCRTKTKELKSNAAPPPPLQYFYCFYCEQRPELWEQGAGELEGCVGSVLSHKGSSSHLPPYSSQPDPYPEPSPAQQARCLIPTKRLPAEGGGGELGRQRRGGAVGAPQRGPLTWSLARWCRRPRQTAPCLLPASFSSLFYQPHGPQGLTGETERREGGGQRTTLTTHPPPPPHSSLGTDLSIPYGQAAALSSSPLRDPSLVCSLLYPSAGTARQATGLCVAKHAPTGCIS